MEISHERQRAIAHEQDENTMRLEVKDLVLEIALEIETLLRRDDQKHEAEKKKGRAEEEEPVDLGPIATPDVEEDRQDQEIRGTVKFN